MSCRGRASRGFTLIEVMVSTVIITLLMFAVYRFVRANLTAIHTANQVVADQQQGAALIDYLRAILEDLPARQQGALLGRPGTFHHLPSDELTWLARAGSGVLTTSAPEEYRVTLAIQPVTKTSSELEIGLRRLPTTVDEKNYRWLPLMRPAAALEVRYFDPRLNAWLERWSDTNLRPALVRVRVWRTPTEPPVESVLPIPSARSQGPVIY